MVPHAIHARDGKGQRERGSMKKPKKRGKDNSEESRLLRGKTLLRRALPPGGIK
jgi:hypothetical protein